MSIEWWFWEEKSLREVSSIFDPLPYAIHEFFIFYSCYDIRKYIVIPLPFPHIFFLKFSLFSSRPRFIFYILYLFFLKFIDHFEDFFCSFSYDLLYMGMIDDPSMFSYLFFDSSSYHMKLIFLAFSFKHVTKVFIHIWIILFISYFQVSLEEICTYTAMRLSEIPIS